MDELKIYTVGGDTVVLGSGVLRENINAGCAEILKGDALHTQAGCVRSTAIHIPRMECGENYFSADCALCFGAYLHALNPEKANFTISTSGLNTPFQATCNAENEICKLSLAGKAVSVLTGAYPCVILGGCTYCKAEDILPEQAQEALKHLCSTGTEPSAALLVKSGETITPYFAQKNGAFSGFSAGSAALALAFLESEQTRDYFEKTYHFPKGDRKVRMKRFLSEVFEATLEAEVKRLG